MSDHEMVKAALGELSSAVKGRLDSLDADIRELAQKRDIATDGGGRGFNPLARIAIDPGVVALRNGQTKSALVQVAAGLPALLTKSTLVGDEASSFTDLFNTQATRAPGIYNDGRRGLRLLDVMQRLPVTGSSFEYNSLDGYTNSADYQVAQGDVKPETSLPTELKVAAIATLAVWIEVTQQVIADAPSLSAALGSLMAYGVAAKLEHEIINGLGGTGQIAGLTLAGNHTMLVLEPLDSVADAVAAAQAELSISGWTASACLVHPRTWSIARRERADSGSGVYVAGSWAQPARATIWGVPVITTPSVAENDVFVIDGSQTLLLDRQQITVEMGRVSDQFLRNCQTLRAEGRFGLAVLSPSAVQYATIGASSGP